MVGIGMRIALTGREPPTPIAARWSLPLTLTRTGLCGCFGRRVRYVPEPITSLTRGTIERGCYTQPVGLGRPATLQAPLAGPLGKRS
jgi:hypothetical protein